MTAKTDWNRIYARRQGVSTLTARLAWQDFLRLLAPHFGPDAASRAGVVVELGGANSIFYADMRAAFPHAALILGDLCRSTPEFAARTSRDAQLHTVLADVLDTGPESALQPRAETADLVFSFGLIEHFTPEETRRAVENHFRLARPGGLVCLSFPTPTLLYRAVRTGLEVFGQWPFPDERPLSYAEVRACAAPLGTELAQRLSLRLGLTQGMLLYRKTGGGA